MRGELSNGTNYIQIKALKPKDKRYSVSDDVPFNPCKYQLILAKYQEVMSYILNSFRTLKLELS